MMDPMTSPKRRIMMSRSSLPVVMLWVMLGLHMSKYTSSFVLPSIRPIPHSLGSTFLNANVAANIILDDMGGSDKNNNNKSNTNSNSNNKNNPAAFASGRTSSSTTTTKKETSTLTRPERKALEREKKARRKNVNHRKHNYADRSQTLRGRRAPGEGRYDLHSNLVSKLSKESTTPEDVITAIKRAQNLHDVHDIRAIARFLLEEASPTFAYGYFASILSRLAVAAMHMKEQSVARKVLEERRLKFAGATLPMESAAIIRGLLRLHNVTDAFAVLNEELALPDDIATMNTPTTIVTSDPMESVELSTARELVKQRALSLGSIASRHFFEYEPSWAVQACQMLADIGPIVRHVGLTPDHLNMPWARIVQGAAQCEQGRRDGKLVVSTVCHVDHENVKEVVLPCNLVYSVLNAMTTFPSTNDDRTYESLSNALIRRVFFVTGAVSMEGCPEADRGEAVFIGRSNVGKSSLINMITNRKALAYTSKTPGKTQQFNFFAVNDKPEKERELRYGDDIPGDKDPDSFYLVDLPGFGFAKVPEKQRQEWSAFMTEYIQTRKTLKVVFHLVDSRHGPTAEDNRIMAQIGEILPKRVNYVVVLTKSDKNIKGSTGKNEGKVSRSVMDTLRETMKANKLGNAPVILTSAETKLGRDDMWRYLRRAAEA